MEFIALQPKITKDFILSKINQESIMQYYTKADVNSKKLFLSPLRSDNHITCSIYKSKSGILYMHDFATNDNLDCWNVVMRMYNCNYYDALKIIAKDFGLVEDNGVVKVRPVIIDSIKETETSKIRVQVKKYSKQELNWWKQFGINIKLLKKYHVYSLQHVFLNGELKFTSTEKCPIYGYYLEKIKTEKKNGKFIFLPIKKKRVLDLLIIFRKKFFKVIINFLKQENY